MKLLDACYYIVLFFVKFSLQSSFIPGKCLHACIHKKILYFGTKSSQLKISFIDPNEQQTACESENQQGNEVSYVLSSSILIQICFIRSSQLLTAEVHSC